MKYENLSSSDRIRVMAEATRACDAAMDEPGTRGFRHYSCVDMGCMVYTQRAAHEIFGSCPHVDQAIARLRPN
jgi:hypothetical protein